MKIIIALVALLAGVFTSSTARAQDWDFAASIYVFAAETEADIGDRSATLSFSDALENLDSTFMGTVTGNDGKWGFLFDFMMTDISNTEPTRGTVFGNKTLRVKTRIASGYLTYRLYNTDTVKTDIMAGARWFDTDNTIALSPGTSPGVTVNARDNWTDPLIGVRSEIAFNDRWSGLVMADYGGTGDRSTWQVSLIAAYDFNENWSARFGYRQIDVSNDGLANNFGFNQSGPIFGVTYRF